MVGAGTLHFIKPDFYLKIMPPYLPLHLELVYLSGFFEIALGVLLLVPRLSRFAAWGIIALLIAVFPANIYVYATRVYDLVNWEPPFFAQAMALSSLKRCVSDRVSGSRSWNSSSTASVKSVEASKTSRVRAMSSTTA